MPPRNCLSVLFLLVAHIALTRGQEEKLTCYQCAGFQESVPEDPVWNTPDCNLDTFSPDNLNKVTNTSTGPTNPVVCYTIAVFVKGLNGNRPITVRDMVDVLVPEEMLIETLPLTHIAPRLVRENRKMFIKGEMCLYDLCNDGTGAFNSTGRTNIAPALLLLALCLHKLLM